MYMKIKQKLVIGFLGVALIVILAGAAGIFISRAIGNSADVILEEKSPLKDISMEAIISLQSGTHAASQYLLRTEGLAELEGEIEESIEDFNMWVNMVRFGTESPDFTESSAGDMYRSDGLSIVTPPGTEEMIQLIEEADHHHEVFTENAYKLIENHREKLKYNFEYAGKNWDFLTFLYLVELQHKKWLEDLADAATDGRNFTGQTDPTKCFFGEWFYNYTIDDPELQTLLAELEPFHIDLHEAAADINEAGTPVLKTAAYQQTVRPIKTDIDEMFTRIRGYIEPVYTNIRELTTSELAVMSSSAQKSEESLEELEGLVDLEMETSMARADRIQRIGLLALLGASGAGIILALLIGIPLAINISRPLGLVTDQSNQVARGNLATRKVEVKTKDEIAQLNDAFNRMIESFKSKANVIDKIAEGILTVDVEKVSDEDGLGESLLQMKDSLHHLISQVDNAVSQVATGSDQVSMASQSLSQGATEQASALEEISSSLTQVNGQARENAQKAGEAATLAEQATNDAEEGNGKMKELREAMDRITAASEKITKVVKVIDDIAFQINLLALNANVEAARAGKYGKGFAVVADEVRNLAVRSGDAVRETSQMVDETVRAIQAGNQSADATARQLEAIVEGSGKVSNFLEEIAGASKEQAQAIEQVTEGLDQIDQVTQSNTASAEQSASASQELAAQAQHMKALIKEFVIDGSRQIEDTRNREERGHYLE